MPIYRSDMHDIQIVQFGGVPSSSTGGSTGTVVGPSNPIVLDTFSGADITQDNAYYFAGNMAPAVPTGGLPTPSDATMTVAWRSDIYLIYARLYTAIATGQPAMAVSIAPKRVLANGSNPSGTALTDQDPLTYTGIALSVQRPQLEAASSSIGYLTITMAPNPAVGYAGTATTFVAGL